jgi:hypothetical protein
MPVLDAGQYVPLLLKEISSFDPDRIDIISLRMLLSAALDHAHMTENESALKTRIILC